MVAIAVGSPVLSDPSGTGAMLLIMAGTFGLWRAGLISNALFATGSQPSCSCCWRHYVQFSTQKSRPALTRRILHGRRGQLYQPYRQGQEDQLGALGLVLNMVVLWNTSYLDAVLAPAARRGYPVRDEDVARLSPSGRNT
jgi:TnpA family transposase